MRINAPCCLHAACTLHDRSEARTQLSRGFRFSSFFFLLTFETVRLVHLFENCLKPRILSSSLWNFKLQYQKKERRRKFRKSCFNNFPAWGKLQRNQQTASWLFTFAGSICCCVGQHGLNHWPVLIYTTVD